MRGDANIVGSKNETKPRFEYKTVPSLPVLSRNGSRWSGKWSLLLGLGCDTRVVSM